MKILIVNDDGIRSEGIKLLEDKLQKYGDVYCVAPLNEQSGNSHSITIRRKFKVEKINDRKYGIDGTPADCVKFGMFIFGKKFDLIVSGINDGPNLGNDIFYSGTVGAASEGILNKVPSIAMSVISKNDFMYADEKFDEVFRYIIDGNLLSDEVVLNVNFPSSKNGYNGIKLTEQGIKYYEFSFKETDGEYHNVTKNLILDERPTADVVACINGHTSITPLKMNRTDKGYLSKIKEAKPL